MCIFGLASNQNTPLAQARERCESFWANGKNMNKQKKIRGHKKLQRRIRKWIELNKTINIGDLICNQVNSTFVSFQPYFNISINNSNIAEPKSKTRNDIILGL